MGAMSLSPDVRGNAVNRFIWLAQSWRGVHNRLRMRGSEAQGVARVSKKMKNAPEGAQTTREVKENLKGGKENLREGARNPAQGWQNL